MTPELPIALPPSVALTELNIDMECSMLRNEARCCNATRGGIVYPTDTGYGIVAFCQFCFDTKADGWIESLEAMIGQEFYR
jgi:hypothetical protein